MIKTRLTPALREEAVSPDDIQGAMQNHERQIASIRNALGRRDDDIDRVNLARELARWAHAACLSEQFDEAMIALDEAQTIYGELGRERPQFLTRLRVAVAKRYGGHVNEALERFDALVEMTDNPLYAIYRTNVLEERGRCRFEAGDDSGALADVEEARRLLGPRGGTKLRSNLEYAVETIRNVNNEH